ncbi:MAG: type II toxin-antitoxin system RelE family toxin [Pseudohongiellaceae bacterium]
MTWKVKWNNRARRELRKLDKTTQATILQYFRERIMVDEDPKRFGSPLRHGLKGLWRYRIGNYRAVCQINDGELVVLVLAVGHRTNIYRS